jgi:hypothetical protein
MGPSTRVSDIPIITETLYHDRGIELGKALLADNRLRKTYLGEEQ